MGNFVVNVKAVGGHGCQRDIKDGGIVDGCGQPGCPDCLAREFVNKLKATLTHWPATPTEVVDNLLSKIRKGNF
jgi:hypothetical protein